MKQKITSLFKPTLTKQLKQTGLLSSSLEVSFANKAINLYEELVSRRMQEQLVNSLLKVLQEKGYYEKKLKVLTFWIQIYKRTKYDLSDILDNKKIKMFSKPRPLKTQLKLSKGNTQQYILYELIIPLYNFFMKLSVNEDLYKHCLIGKIPEDQVFRRGTKIRFIWIFKIYNLIYLLIPILQSCLGFLEVFPNAVSVLEISHIFYEDVLAMYNFVIEALEEGSEDNFMLMPYFDLLQFYESLTQENDVKVKIQRIHKALEKFPKIQTKKPRVLKIDEETLADIKMQVARVKLISFGLKNPKKDCATLVTEYESQVSKQKDRILKTEAADNRQGGIQQFEMKYKFMDQ